MIPSSADPTRWRRLSALLDEALDLAAGERAAWLKALATREPDLACDLEAMLADHAASQRARFLTGSAGPTSGDADVSASLTGLQAGARP